MRKYAVLPVSITVLAFVLLTVTGTISDLHINTASISPLACAAGTVLIAWDMMTLFLNSERSSRNDDIPELTDEEFFAHHKLFGSTLLWWAIPQIVPALYFGTAGKILFSLACFFLALIVTGSCTTYQFRETINNRRRLRKQELALQLKRESGWR